MSRITRTPPFISLSLPSDSISPERLLVSRVHSVQDFLEMPLTAEAVIIASMKDEENKDLIQTVVIGFKAACARIENAESRQDREQLEEAKSRMVTIYYEGLPMLGRTVPSYVPELAEALQQRIRAVEQAWS